MSGSGDVRIDISDRKVDRVIRFNEADWWLLVSSFDPGGFSFDPPTAGNLVEKVEEHEEFWIDYFSQDPEIASSFAEKTLSRELKSKTPEFRAALASVLARATKEVKVWDDAAALEYISKQPGCEVVWDDPLVSIRKQP